MSTPEKQPSFNGKAFIERNAKNKTKFKYRDRVEVRVIVDTFITEKNGNRRPCLIKGKTLRPHKLMAEQMVKDKLVEYVK